MTAVDWSQVRMKAGDWTCPEHGIVRRPWMALVPACLDCHRALHKVVFRNGMLLTEEPHPTHCAGPERHPAGPRQVSLGTWACSCSASGIHRTWTCAQCGDEQMWPPHNEADAAPFFGPGANR